MKNKTCFTDGKYHKGMTLRPLCKEVYTVYMEAILSNMLSFHENEVTCEECKKIICIKDILE